MAKICINCGCKVGFISGEHLDGLLCDNCYNGFGGMTLIHLDGERNAEKYIKCYEKIAEQVDGKATHSVDKEKIKQGFYNLINSKYEAITGLGIKEFMIRKKEAQEKEDARINYAKSFNEFYEYDVVTIINENHGAIDKQKMMRILSDHAKKGWKLHTIYSNELGKNAISILGLGVNSTACEDVLIFERRIPEVDE